MTVTREDGRHVRVAVIGSGFGGLGAGVSLRRAGITDFVILERAGSVGGTWRDNSYPGCACDVPSHLYSFSFAPNATWPRAFSGQPHIREYLERVTDTFGLRPHIRFNAEVHEARWDEQALRWQLTTAQGEFTADVLVSAGGPLSDPSIPDVPGLAGFPGRVFHSARWDHDFDLTGKRVAVVGTGASAIQIVPAIQPKVARLTVLQRTPPWVMPRMDRDINAFEHRLHAAVPATQWLRRQLLWFVRELQVGAFTKRPALMKATAERLARNHLRRAVKDPDLRAKLTPDYTIGCKRILLSNDYYPALTRPNAEVVTSALTEVRGQTIVTADGTERDVDAIVFGTGFHVTDLPIGERVYGRDGRTLAEHWKDGMAALRGCTVDGFPNLLLIIGPNTGLGNSSMVLMIESALRYVVDYLRTLERTGAAALCARPEAVRAWNAALQQRMARTVWQTGGCQSWYQDAAGRNTTLWPGTTGEYRRATRRVKPEEYEIIPAVAAGTPAPRETVA
jgi:cation diffusion facilitator CzcD-associated flavoprotein CzcO